MCMFGTPQAAAPPPPPPMPADPPQQADEAVKKAAADAKARAKGAAGMSSTDVTKGALVSTPAATAGKTATGQ